MQSGVARHVSPQPASPERASPTPRSTPFDNTSLRALGREYYERGAAPSGLSPCSLLPSINAAKRSRVPSGFSFVGQPRSYSDAGDSPSGDGAPPTPYAAIYDDDVSLKASNKSWVVCDHPGELRPRIPLRENCVEILFNRGCSFHSDPPFLFGEGLFSDRFPETCSYEQCSDFFVVAAALQGADEVGCRPRLEPVEPRPRPGRIKRVRNEVLTPAGRPR